MEIKIIIILLIIVLIGVSLFIFLTLKQTTAQLDKLKYRSAWLKIENNFKKENEQGYQMAILNADKLLDKALIELGVKGETMGERMKTFGKGFSNQNGVWMAHKIRNKIAHEHDIDLTFDQSKAALKFFKQALIDVGAI